jgi:hypothetical protein
VVGPGRERDPFSIRSQGQYECVSVDRERKDSWLAGEARFCHLSKICQERTMPSSKWAELGCIMTIDFWRRFFVDLFEELAGDEGVCYVAGLGG